LPSRSKNQQHKPKLVNKYVFANATNRVKNKTTKTQQWLKNIGVLVVNWKYRALNQNRQTKILIMKK
jgi:hypothetical protein